ncbi:SDR family NAD(P)-dependent oxidoreductase [uncultured Jatrophihabitans sp.]|uniref:SDR family NAD(P)-dependent oxidoreductase n=1 Tax=uncultured Jatrophihabitans sp. TaxID=1610747 RepID=UPI0035CB0766
MSKRIVIVGASSGIGLASAEAFARRGDRLLLVARDETALQQAATSCRTEGADDVVTLAADVGKEADVQHVADLAVQRFGGIDVLVHTATVMAYGTIEQLPREVFEEVVDVAIHGTAHLARIVLPLLRQQGSGTVIIVNSLLGSVTVPNMGAYATAKWGQRAVARTLQQEVQHTRGVHVCIVSPGSTNTPIYYQAANYTGRSARPPVPVLQPERTAAAIERLADRPRKHVSVPVGPTNPVIIIGYRLLPFVYDRLVGPLFRLMALTRTKESPNPGNVTTPHPEADRRFGHWPDRAA